MTSPLTSANSYGIRVVANRGPIRQDALEAFAKGSRKATAGIDELIKPRRRSTATAAKKTKRS